jgi:exopolyphosphatase/guanosine-5'-triphosphate,3'-diphosphate pyrophosphatase
VKLAAIDIGSNAIRLLIQEIRNTAKGEAIEKVAIIRVPVRLGADTFESGSISESRQEQLSKALMSFRYLMELYEVDKYRACATSALREATNRDEVVARMKNQTGIGIDVLTGDEEANLIFTNFLDAKINGLQNALFMDVGGGSTELTLIVNGERKVSRSFQLGTVRMLTQADHTESWNDVQEWVKKEMDPSQKLVAIGTGGNINTLFKLQGKKAHEKISLRNIKFQYESIKALSYEQRMSQLKLKPDRADVIVPACEIYLRIMEMAGIEEMVVPKIGLADGIILDLHHKSMKADNEQ